MNYKKLLLLITFISYSIYAQVGIGTTSPDSSSILDVYSSNKGMLLPRVKLNSTTDVSTVASPATSLLVYNTNTFSDVTPGYYYWDGSKWVRLASGAVASSGNSWNLDGNLLPDNTKFLGSTNYYPLNFKVNSTNIGRLYPNGGFYFGMSAQANENRSFAFGQSADASNQPDAFAIGGSTNASGYRSAAIGYGASASQTESFSVGFNATASGYRSMAFGNSALSSQNDAIALGYNTRATGLSATALGYQANASGQNSTAIGYNASTSQANAIVLGDYTNTNNKVGIGTNVPDERLHINGSIKIQDGTQGAGKVLVSDANGKGSWGDLDALKAYGEVYMTNNATLSSGAINLNVNGVSQNVNLTSGSIAILRTGLYRVTYTVTISKSTGSAITPYFYLGVYSTPIPGTRTYCTVSNGDTQTVSMSKLVNLNAYERVILFSSMSDNNTSVVGGATTLNVELIR